MFDPKNDRVDYGKVLTPPDGYGLDFAVGTTYSLDLDAYIGVCMSLGLGAETDGALYENPVFLLDALHKTSDRIALFCEGGQIKCPDSAKKIHALLEKSVFEVALPKRGKTAYPSFHPKFWLVRYTRENAAPKYRVVVLSRNLTFDRSWDVVFSMDGKAESHSDKNEPLKNFLGFLLGYIPKDRAGKEKRRRIQSLVSDLDAVCFSPDTKKFVDFDFLPVGVDKRKDDPDIRTVLGLSGKRYDEMFVMSPFLSNDQIKALNDSVADRKDPDGKRKDPEAVLVTRRESLGKLDPKDCGKFKIFCLRDEVVCGDGQSFSDVPDDVLAHDVHAKVYLTRRYNNKSLVELCLGSMNASRKAVSGNVEFMIRLKTLSRYFDIDKFKSDLFGKDDAHDPFCEAVIPSGASPDAEKDKAEFVVKAISRAKKRAEVCANGDRYDIKLTFGEDVVIESGYSVSLSPLFAGQAKEIAKETVFEDIPLDCLSTFYRVSVTCDGKSVKRTIVVPTDGIPETRDDAVASGLIPDEKSFYAYVAFVLGDDPVLGAIDAGRVLGGKGGKPGAEGRIFASVYEKMLRAAATDPEKLNSVGYIINAIEKTGNGRVCPEKFIDLYETFRKAVKK